MSRFTGPRVKRMRALGTELPGLSAKTPEKRPYPPGQHGQARKKISEFGLRLQEKQKLRLNYGVTEKQLRGLVQEAKRSGGDTGSKLLELLERRLDNVIFRAGFARTIPAARQLVRHGHILVDGATVDIPSYRVRLGETLALHPRSRDLPPVVAALDQPRGLENAPWIAVDAASRTAQVTELPERGSVLLAVKTSLVVEYYSQRL